MVLQRSQLRLITEEVVSKPYWLQRRNQRKKATSLETCACVGWCLVLFMTTKAKRRQCPKLGQAHKGAFCPLSQLQMIFLFWQGFCSECNPALHPVPGLQMQCRYQWDLWSRACVLLCVIIPIAASIRQNSRFPSSLLISLLITDSQNDLSNLALLQHAWRMRM